MYITQLWSAQFDDLLRGRGWSTVFDCLRQADAAVLADREAVQWLNGDVTARHISLPGRDSELRPQFQSRERHYVLFKVLSGELVVEWVPTGQLRHFVHGHSGDITYYSLSASANIVVNKARLAPGLCLVMTRHDSFRLTTPPSSVAIVEMTVPRHVVEPCFSDS